MIDIHDVSGVTGAVAGGPATAPGPDVDVDVAALTGLVAWLGGADGAGRSDAELISELDALERVKSAVAAAQARVTARFVTSQQVQAGRLEEGAAACSAAGDFDGWVAARDAARAKQLPPDPGRTGPSEAADHEDASGGEPGGGSRSRRRRAAALAAKTGVSAQVGLARHESPARGARLARAAVTLVQDLPCTLAALAAGHLSERRAELVVTGTSHLTPEQRALVDAEVIGAHTPGPGDPASSGCAGWGDREVERRVRACADRLDPHGATERARRAREDRRVTVKPVPDCMALVSALLPVEMAVAIFAALAQAAAAAKAAGDPRSRGQVMADTMYQRITGQTSVEDDLGIEVQVVITDRALFDGDETPAHVPGYGPVPAGWVRDRLTADLHDQHPEPPSHTGTTNAGTTGSDPTGTGTTGPPGGGAPPGPADQEEGQRQPGPAGAGADLPGAREARRWLRRLYTHPGTGTLVAMDSTRRLFPAGLRRFLITRDGYCRTPWCDAPIGHADHVRPHAAGGPTSDTNGQGLSIGCNLTKDLPGWHAELIDPGPTAGSEHPHTVQLTTPTGHTYTSTAPPLLPGLIEPAHDTTEFDPTVLHDDSHDDAAAPARDDHQDTPTAVVIELYRPLASTPLEIELTPWHHLAG